MSNYKKVTQIINYLLSHSQNGQLDKWSLVKLAYFADRYHLRKYGRTVSQDKYIAMQKGPVGSLIKDVIECTDYLGDDEVKYVQTYIRQNPENKNILSKVQITDLEQFSDSDIEALNFSINNYGQLTATQLIELTHLYPEWSKFKDRLYADSVSEDMNLSDFFDNPEGLTNDKFKTDSASLNLSHEIFKEYVSGSKNFR